jgi:hypothetical protein
MEWMEEGGRKVLRLSFLSVLRTFLTYPSLPLEEAFIRLSLSIIWQLFFIHRLPDKGK